MKKIALFITGLLLFCPVIAQSQDVDVRLRSDEAGRVILSLGDLKEQTLSAPATSALGFLVRWHKQTDGGSTPVAAKTFRASTNLIRLGLPVDGLFVSQGKNQANVRVLRCQLDGLPIALSCPITLSLNRSTTGTWHVIGVSIP